MARYGLFVLKVPLNTKQTNNQSTARANLFHGIAQPLSDVYIHPSTLL